MAPAAGLLLVNPVELLFLFVPQAIASQAAVGAIVADGDDSDNEDCETRLLPDPYLLLLAGHNAFRFDFPLLLCEFLRVRLSCDCFKEWRYLDTMHIAQVLADHGCKKLQCLVRFFGDAKDLRAHQVCCPQICVHVFLLFLRWF